MIALGLLVLAMGWGAVRGGSRPAAGALVVAGLVVLGIWGLADMPDIHDEGLIGRRLRPRRGRAGHRVLAGAGRRVGAVAAGLAALTLRPGRRRA